MFLENVAAEGFEGLAFSYKTIGHLYAYLY
jgi:hypothetical protein